MYDTILYDVKDPVAVITLNRPDKLNAFTYPMLGELRDAVERAAGDPAVVGIVITGAGRGFCAGLDAAALAAASDPDQDFSQRPSGAEPEIPGLFTYLLAIDKPVIAAVNGVAAGGGFVLAVMCDVRFAAPEAMFTTIFSQRGLIAEHGTSWIVPRLLGAGRALDLLWTSRRVHAGEAHQIGLVEYLCEGDALADDARSYIEQLAATVSPASMADTKRLVYEHLGVGYEAALRQTQGVMNASLKRADAREGVASFVERRPPSFERIGKK